MTSCSGVLFWWRPSSWMPVGLVTFTSAPKQEWAPPTQHRTSNCALFRSRCVTRGCAFECVLKLNRDSSRPEIEPPSRRGRRDLREIWGFQSTPQRTLSRRKSSRRANPVLSQSDLCVLCGSAVSPLPLSSSVTESVLFGPGDDVLFGGFVLVAAEFLDAGGAGDVYFGSQARVGAANPASHLELRIVAVAVRDARVRV